MPEYLNTPSGSETDLLSFILLSFKEDGVPEYLHTPPGSEIALLSFIDLLCFKEIYMGRR